MKLTIVILITSLLHVSAAGFAQRISLNKNKASLHEVIREIRKQSGYDFVITTPQIRAAKPVSINVQYKTLKEALDECFADQPFTYAIEGKIITIVNRPVSVAANPQPPVVIKGRVKDSNGKALPGASVMVLGTRRAAMTNAEGYFTIVVTEKSVLRISMIGFQSVDVPVNDQKELDIVLKEQEQELGELVVVGYGQIKKENLTTSVSTITSEQITQMPTSNLSQVFAGRIPGILARTSSGVPGADDATLLIRTTAGSNARPLLVIDGVPRIDASGNGQMGLGDIDPNEVESISVLRDNAAGAVYGSRAANGVIIVTTKRGKLGKPQFNYVSNLTWSRAGKMVKNTDAYTYALTQNEIAQNNGLAMPYSAAVLDTIQRQLAPYKYANTDWIKLLTGKPALVQNHSLNINGGVEAVRYYISGSYTDQQGMYPGNSLQRYTLQSNFDVNLSKQFKAQVNLGYRTSNQNIRGGSGAMNTAVNTSPLTPAYMPNGTFAAGVTNANPLASISEKSGYQYVKDNFLTMLGKLTWEPTFLKGFSAYANIGSEKFFQRDKSYQVPVPQFRLDPSSPTGYFQAAGAGKPTLTDKNSDANSYTADIGLNYKYRFGKHGIEALVLYTQSESSSNSNSDMRLNLVAPGLDILNLGSTVGEVTSGNRTLFARAGYVGRLNYDFDNRIFFESSFRYDGSVAFAPGNRWGFFPGASAGWMISREKFFAGLSNVVNSLKIRASIGLTGDDAVGANSYYYTYGIANTGNTAAAQAPFGYIFGTAYTPTFYLANGSLPNENITWAKNRQENIGIDAMLWGRKLGITFDIYQKNRYDMLKSSDAVLPGTFGISGPIQNFAKMRDRGFDLELTSEQQLAADWKLTLNANVTYVRTEWINNGTKLLPDYQRMEGRSTNAQVGYHSLGIFQNTAEIAAWPVDQDGLKNASIKPGDIKFADRNGDGKLTVDDQIWMDNMGFPPINFGFGFNLKHKGMMLSAFFNGAMGGYIRYAINSNWQYMYDNSWRPGNESAKYPRLASSTNNSRSSDATLIKDDFLRLRDVRLSYELPKKWLDVVKLKQVRLYAQASNLFTWTSVLGGIDPETPNLGTGGASGGFYPNQKNIGFGVNVNF
ncbi:TonB-linked SusC/RagA family outer membrane protein [Pedobacter africanus]|uniref:TonB-linked SusC/RagA family outer membrane protein n=1 Tax=Pedobacter africanus TaxID=151894 RepID=A0ACC6KX97_9SPHI|nr:TonB-dependent receptor [Pedobacter africanus]MDR6784003.1 TonB-linked SusC/RagA family outer membrane protein [Pedobacter africanus]